jgi:hypothetical protein
MKLIQLFQQMSDHTKDRCGECKGVHPVTRCCQPEYCDMARDFAQDEFGVKLEPTGHPTLPFMGEKGCVVAPHLRPLCTLHDCAINSRGTTGNGEWDERYFSLRAQIDEALFEFEESKMAKDQPVLHLDNDFTSGELRALAARDKVLEVFVGGAAGIGKDAKGNDIVVVRARNQDEAALIPKEVNGIAVQVDIVGPIFAGPAIIK